MILIESTYTNIYELIYGSILSQMPMLRLGQIQTRGTVNTGGARRWRQIGEEQNAVDMLTKAGLTEVESFNSVDRRNPGLAIHELGTARMGRDPKDSVLNGDAVSKGN